MLMNSYNNFDMDLCNHEFFQLNTILNKMVFNNCISQEEKEELLHKSGLTKLEDGSWEPTSIRQTGTKLFLSETL
jgi:hypothetical protein